MIQKLHPSYFAMVMSTSVISIACHLLKFEYLSQMLGTLAVLVYGVLWLMTIGRVVWFTKDFLADWSNHQRSVGFFTTVAATCIVGTQSVIIWDQNTIGRGLWWTGLLLWCLCMYGIFTCLTVREEKPTLAEGISGGWLVAVVATQSLVVLGCLVWQQPSPNQELAIFVLLALWLCGGMLYIWMISLIFYRYTFFKFLPSDLMPPYWINMGAMAISTLAGALLIRMAPMSELLQSFLPFLRGFTLWYWATATWWIPMLFILAVWRHVLKRFPFSYDPLYWGAVFPMGMYATSTFRLAETLNVPFLFLVSKVFIIIALLTWTATFAGWVCHLRGIASSSRFAPCQDGSCSHPPRRNDQTTRILSSPDRRADC